MTLSDNEIFGHATYVAMRGISIAKSVSLTVRLSVCLSVAIYA